MTGHGESYEWNNLIRENVEVRIGLPTVSGMKVSYNPDRFYSVIFLKMMPRFDEHYLVSSKLTGAEFVQNTDVWMRKI